MSVEPTGSTACHTNNAWHYTLALDTAIGKNMYALLFSLAAANQPVTLGGLGECNEFGSIESLRSVGVVY